MVGQAHRLKAASRNFADELLILPGFGHTEGVRKGEQQEEVSPIREMFLRRVREFFKQSLK